MNISQSSILSFTFGKFSPNIGKIFNHKLAIIFELSQHLFQYTVSHIDPREYLFSHDPTKRKLSRVVPISDFEGLEDNTEIFSTTWNLLQQLFPGRIENAFLSILLPGAETCSYAENGSKKVRVYIPLILPDHLSTTGIWVSGYGVLHFRNELWYSHFMTNKHSIFNYTDTNVYILVIDINCAPKMEDLE